MRHGVYECRAAYTGLVRAVDQVVIHRPRGLGRRADGDVLLGGELEQIRTSTIGRQLGLWESTGG